MSDALTIQDIETLKPEIKNDFSGTRQLPILAAVVPGKCGTGTVWITKQGNRYYPMTLKRRNKKSDNLRCSEYRNGCKYTENAKNIENLTDDAESCIYSANSSNSSK